ncbi:MAG: class I mannose-6-phosphate isomerase, partial [Sciscionella sp.]
MTVKLKPTPLPTNQPTQFYRGGSAIAALRGETRREYGPEDWVASTTTRFGEPESGLSVLPGGELLISAVQADPLGWLGTDHVAAFGASTALLVKLLDAGQRLPVHCHPSDHFAQCHFHSPIGKTEAWIVIGTGESDATVHAGFHTAVELDTAAAWVRNQDRCAMLGSLNRLDVAVGDTVFIPAGLPHSIGAGVFVVELQQPTDFSITLEWQDFLADEAAGHLGIGFDKALLALD